jgi:hypothetical protein
MLFGFLSDIFNQLKLMAQSVALGDRLRQYGCRWVLGIIHEELTDRDLAIFIWQQRTVESRAHGRRCTEEGTRRSRDEALRTIAALRRALEDHLTQARGYPLRSDDAA